MNPSPQSELLQLVRALRGHILTKLNTGGDLSFLRVEETFAHEKGAQERYLHYSAVDQNITEPSTLARIREELGDCRRCHLYKGRRNIVFGEGCESPPLVFVGEAPGVDEDRLGRPFVGRAGQLLTRIIAAMGLKREEVYICNILKCRPPDNRNPLPEEIKACEPFLRRQIAALRPKLICALGTFAAHTLLGTEVPITILRGNFQNYQGIRLMPTYHPAYLLRNEAAKKLVWEDMQKVMKALKE